MSWYISVSCHLHTRCRENLKPRETNVRGVWEWIAYYNIWTWNRRGNKKTASLWPEIKRRLGRTKPEFITLVGTPQKTRSQARTKRRLRNKIVARLISCRYVDCYTEIMSIYRHFEKYVFYNVRKLLSVRCIYFLLGTAEVFFDHILRLFWSHTIRHTVGLLCTSDQPVAEASTYTGQHSI
jgi:hypothetical protein